MQQEERVILSSTVETTELSTVLHEYFNIKLNTLKNVGVLY